MNDCECPRCGGLPINHRCVNVEVDVLFRRGGDVFGFPSERPLDWVLEEYLHAAEADGSETLTCEDCNASWRAAICIEAVPRLLQRSLA